MRKFADEFYCFGIHVVPLKLGSMVTVSLWNDGEQTQHQYSKNHRDHNIIYRQAYNEPQKLDE